MMTRREFIKVAGAGALAVSCAGLLSGCDIAEALQDQGAAKATIGNVTFMMETSILTFSDSKAQYSTLFHIRNKNADSVTIPANSITGVIYDCGNTPYSMTYTGQNITVAGNSDKVEIRDFALKTSEEVSSDSSLKTLKYQKAIITIAYGGKKAVFTDDNAKNAITPRVE